MPMVEIVSRTLATPGGYRRPWYSPKLRSQNHINAAAPAKNVLMPRTFQVENFDSTQTSEGVVVFIIYSPICWPKYAGQPGPTLWCVGHAIR